MKKVLKKLGLAILMIGVLIPVINLPMVNAEENNCKNHLQNYLFLDEFMFTLGEDGTEWVNLYSSDDNGRTTSTYFLNAFPEISNSKTISVTSVERYNLDENQSYENDLKKYWQVFNSIAESPDGMYAEGLENNKKYTTGEVFVRNSINKDYVDISTFIHGIWQDQDKDGNFEYAFWEAKGEKDSSGKINVDNPTNHSLQKVLGKVGMKDKMSIEILASTTGTDGNIIASKNKITPDYFNDMIKNKTNIKEIDGLETFPISIKRTLDFDDASEFFNQLVFGADDGVTKRIYVYDIEKFVGDTTGKTVDEIIDMVEEGEVLLDSYDALHDVDETMEEKETINTITAEKLNISKEDFNKLYNKLVNIEINKYYYWPAILAVEYETCTITEETATWNLEYEGNVEDNSVKNIPIGSSSSVGTSIEVSNETPSREGYVFKKWCEDPEGKNPCYQAGDEVNSDDAATITLFAQWAKVGTTDNNKTGVVSYIIGFMTIGLIAGGAYYIARKKNLFKQV